MRLNSRQWIPVAGALTAVLGVAVFVHVLGLSGESGTTFAPYSTYRADPLGMMALYNALDRMEGVATDRYIGDFSELPLGNDSTLVIAGASIGPDPVPVLDVLEGFAATGGRIVIAFYPIGNDLSLEALDDELRARDRREEEDEAATDGETADEEEAKSESDTAAPTEAPQTEETPAKESEKRDEREPEDELMDFGPPVEDLSERWDFEYEFAEPPAVTRLARLDEALPVEANLEGRSGLYFVPPDEGWTNIYGKTAREGEVTQVGMMERKIGSGTIVLCSDAFFLSNEALRKNRNPELLSWLLGGNRTVLFSEAHLGTRQQDRIMTLVRRYRLHGVLFGFLLLGILFVWHHAATLIPRRDVPPLPTAATAAERSHQDGLDNLLARFIPRSALLDTCVREWCQQFQHDPRLQQVRQIAASRGISEGKENDLVAVYNEISRELHHK
ncbi:MAG: hypothetical protein JNK74_03230 [Candidatus Hydrogenedentes bacterium]|nr:hypothetical protein [Candidatus Hydrogenedentota bacterium]